MTDTDYKYFIGNLYNVQKQKHGGGRSDIYIEENSESSGQNVHLPKTEETIAEEFKIDKRTVRRHAQLATAIDSIGDNCGEDVKQKILDKEIMINPPIELLPGEGYPDL